MTLHGVQFYILKPVRAIFMRLHMQSQFLGANPIMQEINKKLISIVLTSVMDITFSVMDITCHLTLTFSKVNATIYQLDLLQVNLDQSKRTFILSQTSSEICFKLMFSSAFSGIIVHRFYKLTAQIRDFQVSFLMELFFPKNIQVTLYILKYM